MLAKLFVCSVLFILVKGLNPYVYLRFYYQLGKAFKFPLAKYRENRMNTFGIQKPEDLFKWISLGSYVSPFDVDMYLNKSQSSYFPDLDLSRTTTLARVFQKLFLDYHDNVNGEFKSQGLANIPYIPIETVQCSFNLDLKLFHGYVTSSRIFAWDQKWLIILSKFTSGEKIHAYALTKYVLKKNGKLTMVPEEYIKACGLWHEAFRAENLENYKVVQSLANNGDWDAIVHQEKIHSKVDLKQNLL